jgi:Spy/CpxP family protein refolding chaperone
MRMTFAALFAVVSLITRPVLAQEQHPPRNWGMDSTLYERLSLTPDQRTKIKAIRDQVMQQNAPLRDQIRQVLGDKSPRDMTPEEREQYRPKIEPIRKQMMENRKKGRDQIMAILTPDQRKQFEQIEKEMREHRQERGEGPPS